MKKIREWLIALVREAIREELKGLDVVTMVTANQPSTVDTEEAFPIARTPRRVPWRIRKREKEAAARTKRKAIEEFRETA